jgi:iron-sulfur cluster assembly protein
VALNQDLQSMSENSPVSPRRARPKVLTLTEAAAARVKAIMASKGPEVLGLKIGIKKGGCAGMEYTMTWADRIEKFDEVVEAGGARVIVDPQAVLYLLGTEMDYKADKLSATFVFNNPNQKGSCGCGESVTLEAAGEADLEPVKN